MNWSRITQWAEVSDCERYTVSVSKSGESYSFTAWRRATNRAPPTELGCFNDIALAKQACADDAKAKAAAP